MSAPSALPDAGLPSAAAPALRTAYQDLRDRLTQLGGGAKRTGPEDLEKEADATDSSPKPDRSPAWMERMELLKKRLSEPLPESDEKAPDAKPDSELTPEEREKKEQRAKALAGLDDETLRMIREAGGDVESYITGAPGSLFGEHMRAGQELMNSGQYFDAEERFARALAMRPGEATVMAARLHAQVGAGLYVSAAVNLRQMFELHPEVIGVRWKGPTMPSRARLASLTKELRENLSKSDKPGLSVPEESALLLAYLGFQTEQEDDVRSGLSFLKKARPNDALIEVLERVWLNPTPAPAPTPDTK